jgi:hypothetical protein
VHVEDCPGCKVTAAFDSLEEQLEAAHKALRDIEALESDNGTYDVVWDGVRQWVPKFKVLARAGLNPASRQQ